MSTENTTTELTYAQFKGALPPGCRTNLKPSMMDKINGVITNPVLRESFRENLISYTHVLNEGKYKMDSYISAVKYVSCKLMGASNTQAYIKTFPDRYQKFLDRGVPAGDIASYVSSYNRNKLVNLILEQTLVPTYILNADMYQKALNTQAELMVSANSEKVRTDAANSILTHLKRPEAKKIELDIGIKQDSTIADLRSATQALVNQQKEQIKSGGLGVKDVAHSSITRVTDDVIEGELVDDALIN